MLFALAGGRAAASPAPRLLPPSAARTPSEAFPSLGSTFALRSSTALTPRRTPATPLATARGEMLGAKLRTSEVAQRLALSPVKAAAATPNASDTYVTSKFDRTHNTWVQKTVKYEQRDGRIVMRKEVKVIRP